MSTEAPTAANLLSLLQECAANAPGDDRDTRVGWGFSAAARLIAEAMTAGLGAAVSNALEKLFRSTDANEVWLAMACLSLEDLATLGLAARDPSRWPEQVQGVWRIKLAAIVARGLVKYDPKWRAFAATVNRRSWIAAFIAHDTAWFWQNVTTVLGSKPADVTSDLMEGLMGLTRAEAEHLSQALPSHAIDPAIAAAMAEALRRMLADGEFAASSTPASRAFSPR